MAEFCFYLTDSDSFLSLHNYHHDASDVDWWLSHHHLAQYSDATSGVIRAFSLVHENVSIIRLSPTPMSKCPPVPLVRLPPLLQGVEEVHSSVCQGKWLVGAHGAGNAPGSIQTHSPAIQRSKGGVHE
jgi:hypothetical protein